MKAPTVGFAPLSEDVRISSTGAIISSTGTIISSNGATNTSSKISTSSSQGPKYLHVGNATNIRQTLVEGIERYRPYPAANSPITPFAKLLLPKSELAYDNLDTYSLPNLAINTTVLTSGGFLLGMLSELFYWREPKQNFIDRKWIIRCTKNILFKSFYASVPISLCYVSYSQRNVKPATVQLLEEHVILKQKEKSRQIKDIRNAFDKEDDYERFMHRQCLDSISHAGAGLGAGLGGISGLLISRSSLYKKWRKKSPGNWKPDAQTKNAPAKGNVKWHIFKSTIFGAFGGLCLGFTITSMYYQSMTGGSVVRERIRKHRLETREAHMADLGRIKEIQSARALRIKELKKLKQDGRLDDLVSELQDAALAIGFHELDTSSILQKIQDGELERKSLGT